MYNDTYFIFSTQAANSLVDGAAAAEPTPISQQASPLEHPDYQRLPVFLSNLGCPFTPHVLHCVKVFPGMVLIIVSQVCEVCLVSKIVWGDHHQYM